MKEVMSPHRTQSEESLYGLNLGMFGMLYNLYSDLYGVLAVEIRCVPCDYKGSLQCGVLTPAKVTQTIEYQCRVANEKTS